MGKALSIAVGGIVAFLGLILLIFWWNEFIVLLKAVVPAIFILGGLLALFAGISELKDTLKSKK